MAEPDDEVQKYLGELSFKLKRELVTVIRREADGLADAIKAEAPRLTGALAESVQVRRTRNDLSLEVTAGGDATTKEVRKGSGEDYDYALAVEYGTADRPAEPFFYSTYRRMQPQIEQNIQAAVQKVVSE